MLCPVAASRTHMTGRDTSVWATVQVRMVRFSRQSERTGRIVHHHHLDLLFRHAKLAQARQKGFKNMAIACIAAVSHFMVSISILRQEQMLQIPTL